MRIYTTYEQAKQLPQYHQQVVPENYRDAMGHMNVRYYMALFDDGGWGVFDEVGLDAAYTKEHDAGGFDLRSFITYIAEVHIGETVSVHARLIGCSASRLHLLYFLVNESTQTVAATMETLTAHADLKARKIAPFPPDIRKKLEAIAAEHQALDWEAPLCGIMKV